MNEDIIHFINNINFENTDEVYNIIYKLQHNWNELKKLMEEETRQYWSEDILIIMGQLEEGGNNE